jgi:hypothetical protein
MKPRVVFAHTAVTFDCCLHLCRHVEAARRRFQVLAQEPVLLPVSLIGDATDRGRKCAIPLLLLIFQALTSNTIRERLFVTRRTILD